MIRGEAFIVVGWRPPRTTRSGESPDWSNIWPQRWERASSKRTIPHTMYTSTGITIIPVLFGASFVTTISGKLPLTYWLDHDHTTHDHMIMHYNVRSMIMYARFVIS